MIVSNALEEVAVEEVMVASVAMNEALVARVGGEDLFQFLDVVGRSERKEVTLSRRVCTAG